MSELVPLLKRHSFRVGVTRTRDPGLIVYADEHQYTDEHQVAALRCSPWHRLGYRAKGDTGPKGIPGRRRTRRHLAMGTQFHLMLPSEAGGDVVWIKEWA